MHNLPETGYLRLPQIVGDPKAAIPAIIPVSKSTWWAGVKSGRYPAPREALPQIDGVARRGHPGADRTACRRWRRMNIAPTLKRAIVALTVRGIVPLPVADWIISRYLREV